MKLAVAYIWRSRHDTKPIHSARALAVSYLGVRRGIGAVGLLLPILLGPVGWLVFGIEIQDNMSSYSHTVLRDVYGLAVLEGRRVARLDDQPQQRRLVAAGSIDGSCV